MSRFYRIKRHFLIRLLSALGFGSVIAYSICSCDSKPVSQDVKQSDTQVDSEANKEIEFQIEVTPSDAEVYILENNTETLLSSKSPCTNKSSHVGSLFINTKMCTYRFDTAKNSVGLKISARDHKSEYRVITKDTNPKIKVDLQHQEYRPQIRDTEYRAKMPDLDLDKPDIRPTRYRARTVKH